MFILRFNKILVSLLLGIIFGIISYVIVLKNNFSTQDSVKTAQRNLNKKETIANSKLLELNAFLKTNKSNDLFTRYNKELINLYQQDKIACYVFKKDSLCYWTDNQPAGELENYQWGAKVQLIKLKNGWYEYIRLKDNVSAEYTIIALILIKSEYEFENKYLTNEFSDWLKLPPNTKLITPAVLKNQSVKSKFGTLLFEIKRSEDFYINKTMNTFTSIFECLALVFFSISFYYFLLAKIKNNLIRFAILTLSSFVVRTLMIFYEFPNSFYLEKLYDANLFANASSFYFGFLGDIIINSVLIFILSVHVYKQKIELKNTSLIFKLFFGVFSFLFLEYFAYNIPSLIYSLIYNSTLSFNITQLFDFSVYTFLGLASVGLMFYAFYLLLEKTISILIDNSEKQYRLLLFGLLIISLFVFFLKLNDCKLIDYLWTIPLMAVSYLFKRFKATYNFINIGLILLIATFIISYFIFNYEHANKENTYNALSFTLTDKQDVIVENEFSKINQTIKADLNIKKTLTHLPSSNKAFTQKIKEINANGYFERYDIVFSLFKNQKNILSSSDLKYLDANYFENQIKKDGLKTICDNLFFINKNNLQIRYIGKIDLTDASLNKDSIYQLYFQLDPKTTSDVGFFPDLLIDKSLQMKIDYKNISYAIYQNNKLKISHGNYQYPVINNTYQIFKNNNDVDYEHHIYQSSNNVVIITDNKTGFWQLFTLNSYLFIFFSLIVVFSVWYNTIIINKVFAFSSLNNRIQYILVSIIILSLAGVVFGTIRVVTTQFETKNKNELLSKSKSVLKELQESIGQQNELDEKYKDYTTHNLKKLSKIFGSEISLFDNKGKLFATSQPAVYSQGLISELINAEAYSDLLQNKTTNYSQKENIGKLNYLSTYISFYNTNDKLIGYLNLPYFSRQQDLEKELSVYLTTLINIYTLLFIITTIIALFISNLLTKPLRIIKQQISDTKFGSQIKTIEWNSNDEIGNLVSEYNTMLIELEKSSELLAQSERENAWREMSKQVAHEIKNPLTPMKLNIQHLQRVVKSNPENVAKKVDEVSEILIQQIDILSNIANEFSYFAKLPNTKLEKTNLAEILKNETNLFKKSSNCVIECNTPNELFSLVDKEQFARALTNLIKNAEQSIDENKTGNIKIEASKLKETIEIKISDNGSGIPHELYSKIFKPNFTTKNYGNGLGLAMVKNSVLAFNGIIYFESNVNVGTTFIIELPIYV